MFDFLVNNGIVCIVQQLEYKHIPLQPIIGYGNARKNNNEYCEFLKYKYQYAGKGSLQNQRKFYEMIINNLVFRQKKVMMAISIIHTYIKKDIAKCASIKNIFNMSFEEAVEFISKLYDIDKLFEYLQNMSVDNFKIPSLKQDVLEQLKKDNIYYLLPFMDKQNKQNISVKYAKIFYLYDICISSKLRAYNNIAIKSSNLFDVDIKYIDDIIPLSSESLKEFISLTANYGMNEYTNSDEYNDIDIDVYEPIIKEWFFTNKIYEKILHNTI